MAQTWHGRFDGLDPVDGPEASETMEPSFELAGGGSLLGDGAGAPQAASDGVGDGDLGPWVARHPPGEAADLESDWFEGVPVEDGLVEGEGASLERGPAPYAPTPVTDAEAIRTLEAEGPQAAWSPGPVEARPVPAGPAVETGTRPQAAAPRTALPATGTRPGAAGADPAWAQADDGDWEAPTRDPSPVAWEGPGEAAWQTAGAAEGEARRHDRARPTPAAGAGQDDREARWHEDGPVRAADGGWDDEETRWHAEDEQAEAAKGDRDDEETRWHAEDGRAEAAQGDWDDEGTRWHAEDGRDEAAQGDWDDPDTWDADAADGDGAAAAWEEPQAGWADADGPPSEAPAPRAPRVIRARPATVSARILAWTVDGGVLAGTLGLFAWLAGQVAGGGEGLSGRLFSSPGAAGALLLLGITFSVLYTALFTAAGGQTPGARLARIRVLDRRGATPEVGRALRRALLAVPGTLIFLVGLAWALLDEHGQTLHDRVAGTYVVER